MPVAKTKTATTKTGVSKTTKTAAKKPAAVKVKPMTGKKTVAAMNADLKSLPTISREFVSRDCAEDYSYAFGRVVASAFSGFIAGIIITSFAWVVIVNVFFIQQ